MSKTVGSRYRGTCGYILFLFYFVYLFVLFVHLLAFSSCRRRRIFLYNICTYGKELNVSYLLKNNSSACGYLQTCDVV